MDPMSKEFDFNLVRLNINGLVCGLEDALKALKEEKPRTVARRINEAIQGLEKLKDIIEDDFDRIDTRAYMRGVEDERKAHGPCTENIIYAAHTTPIVQS